VYLETGNHIKILRYELDLALSKWGYSFETHF
jgi:hypothetical protein